MYDASLPVRQRLKLATGAAHASLEAKIGPLTNQTTYNEYVRGLHAFRSAAENWLFTQRAPAFGAWKPLRLAHHLHDDISDLALTPLSVSALTWAQVGRSFVMGVHYVLEGSALGARVLVKQVEALGMSRHRGARHLWAQAETLANWRGFLDLLARHDGEEDALFAGANAAFSAAAGAMERAAHV